MPQSAVTNGRMKRTGRLKGGEGSKSGGNRVCIGGSVRGRVAA